MLALILGLRLLLCLALLLLLALVLRTLHGNLRSLTPVTWRSLLGSKIWNLIWNLLLLLSFNILIRSRSIYIATWRSLLLRHSSRHVYSRKIFT